jgi:hypothetical protein
MGQAGRPAGAGWGKLAEGQAIKPAWLSHLAWILVCQGSLGDAPSPEGVSLARVRESMATWRALVSAARNEALNYPRERSPLRGPAKVQPYMTYA